MKILKEGNPAKAVISCPRCRCEMEYTNKDMHKAYGDYGNQTCWPIPKNNNYRITCPCCGEEITVNKL